MENMSKCPLVQPSMEDDKAQREAIIKEALKQIRESNEVDKAIAGLEILHKLCQK